MRFLADMGISKRVAEWLRANEHDVVHLQDRGLHRLPDGQIFELAAKEQRTILTFDLDFPEIIALSKSKTVSAIVFRLNNTTTSFVIQRIARVLADTAAELEQGAIVMVEDGRQRVRQLPIGS